MSSLQETIDRALAAAGLRDRDGPVRRSIDSALATAGLLRQRPPGPTGSPAGEPVLLDERDDVYVPVDEVEAPATGTFTSHTHRGAPGSLAYRLYVPAARRRAAMPLLVMLHGCKQDPDDFAAGTRMNVYAERHGFAVAYPAQSVRANGSNCWNWFEPAQQQREGREPALIAGIVHEIAGRIDVDRRRVFVAGLSAGAAMAVVLGRHHPELFAGIAVHSGLPLGAAHDVPSAFAAMRGRAGPTPAVPPAPSTGPPVRTLVLHGDADATVAASNGDAVVAQAIAAFDRGGHPLRPLEPLAVMHNGRHSVRSDHVDAAGRVAVRDWRVRGAGHAWFGGSPAGSYTDVAGPDASAEVVAFFLGEEDRS